MGEEIALLATGSVQFGDSVFEEAISKMCIAGLMLVFGTCTAVVCVLSKRAPRIEGDSDQ